MATVRKKIFGMKFAVPLRLVIGLLALSLLSLPAADNLLNAVKDLHTKSFTSEWYFDPPHEQQVNTRLTCAEAAPLPGGLLDLSAVKIESFDDQGRLEAVVETPRCTFAPLAGWANSPGHLRIRSGDGLSWLEGDGFWLRRTNSLLSISISNHVHTVIQLPENHGGSL